MTTTTACHLCGTPLIPWPSGIGLMCPHCDRACTLNRCGEGCRHDHCALCVLIWIWGGEDDRWASTGVVVGAAVFSATLACALMESGPFARLPKPARRDDT